MTVTFRTTPNAPAASRGDAPDDPPADVASVADLPVPRGFAEAVQVSAGNRCAVYRARQVSSGESVILKVFALADLELCRREHALLESLDIPGVVRAREIARGDDHVTLVLDDCGGAALHAVVGELALADALALVARIARVLSDVHAAGVIHRDVSPRNIVWDPDSDSICLVDFGLADLLDTSGGEAPCALEGTLPYISPEQTGRTRLAVDGRSDLYSLGATFYELLTGAPPFASADPLELVHAHLAVEPRPPRELAPAVPPVVSDIVMKLLRKAPDQRYQTAAGLAEDLEECVRRLRTSGAIAPFELGRRDAEERFEVPTRLYGRERQLHVLGDAFSRAANGLSQVVVLAGASGTGKTSLVREAVARDPRVTLATGKFEQHGTDVPYAGLVDALRALVRRTLSEDEDQLRRRRRALTEALGRTAGAVAQVLPDIELVCGPQSAPAEVGGAEARNRLNLALENVVHAFARLDGPLVLFLDDVQWADASVLETAVRIGTMDDPCPLVLLLAMRDDEVDEGHPARQAVEALRAGGADVKEVLLGPLAASEVRAMVADALRVTPREAAELGGRIASRCDGNPFLARQLLELLRADGVIRYDAERHRFTYDARALDRSAITDDVAGVLTRKLRHLPDETLRALRMAAVLGPRFDAPTLATLLGCPASEVARALRPAVEADLVVPGDPADEAGAWVFLHDRIEAAAYQSLEEAERVAAHAAVGGLLRRSLGTEEASDGQLFATVGHLESGLEAVRDEQARLELAELAVKAARESARATAFHGAARWYRLAASLYEERGWGEDHERCMDVHVEWADALGNAARHQECFEILERARSLARSGRDRVRIATVEVAASVSATMDVATTVARGAEAAGLMGITLPTDPEAIGAELGAVIGRVVGTLAQLSDEDVLGLPPMEDPDALLLMPLLFKLSPPAFLQDPRLNALVTAHMVALTLEHGVCPESTYALPTLGIALTTGVGDYDTAYRLGRLGLALSERTGDMSKRASVLFIHAGFCAAWRDPFEVVHAYYREAERIGKENGDALHANTALTFSLRTSLLGGTSLAVVGAGFARATKYFEKLGDGASLGIHEPMRRLTEWLREGSATGVGLDGDGFDEEAHLARVSEVGNSAAEVAALEAMTIQRFMAGHFEEALGYVRRSELRRPPNPPFVFGVHAILHGALVRAAVHRTARGDREQLEARVEAAAEKLKTFAARCPENFGAMALLAEAESARIHGDFYRAMDRYDRAIAEAREARNLRLEAMAHELAGRAWMARGQPDFGRACLVRARAAYGAWGAEVKVGMLEREFPRLVPAPMGIQRIDDTLRSTEVGADALDLASVIRASQAISSELELDALLGTLVRVIMRNAGATGAALVLAEDGELVVGAIDDADESMPRLPAGESVEAAGLPARVVSYVWRTGETLVVDDARSDERWRGDAAVAARGTRSLLCAPIALKGAPIGVMFLDNRHAARVFTDSRLEALGILLTQVAVSIDNARLFARQKAQAEELERYHNHLQELVEERTAELKATQGQLLEVSRLAGMAEVATSVLHNVGNALNSVNVSAELIDARLRKLPLLGVGKAANLLAERAPELGPWFAEGQQGDKLIAYLRSLEAECENQLGRVQQESRSLQERVEHVKVIISQQQAYGRVTTLVDECSVADVVGQAIAIVAPSCRSHGISLSVELTDERRTVRIDRHQVLQILVNLLTNAKHAVADAGRPDGWIRLEVPAGDERLVVRVVDNGIGIAADDLTRVFVHGFTKRKGGHGFGLHNAVNAARTMGGELTCSSEGPGQGAEFVLDLPARAVEAA